MQTLIHHALIESARRNPDAKAIFHKGQWMTYGEIDSASTRLSSTLRREGTQRGDRVVLLLENSFTYVISYFAILKSGAVVVSFDTEILPAAAERLIRHAEAVAIITSHRHASLYGSALTQAGSIKLAVVDSNETLSCEHTGNLRWRTFAACIASGDDHIPASPCIDVDCASIVYTSGTTGNPKGVMLSHLNIVSNTRSIVQYLHLTNTDRIMCVLPFHYVYGLTLLNTHVLTGGSVVLENGFLYPNVILETMAQQETTGFAGVPSTFMILLQKSSIRDVRLPSLRYVTQAGGAMAPAVQKEVAQVFSPAQLVVMYGATELSPRLTYVPTDRLNDKWGSIGIPIPNTEAFIANEEGVPLDPGTEGEIVARGSNVMMGYLNDPLATQAVLRHGLYFTGDRGVMDTDGFLYVVGRTSDMIKSGGYRICAGEIEEAILTLSGVMETAVIPIPDAVLGEAVKAFVVKCDGALLDEFSLRKALSSSLSGYKIPKTVVFISSLPKNQSGKVLKKMLV